MDSFLQIAYYDLLTCPDHPLNVRSPGKARTIDNLVVGIDGLPEQQHPRSLSKLFSVTRCRDGNFRLLSWHRKWCKRVFVDVIAVGRSDLNKAFVATG